MAIALVGFMGAGKTTVGRAVAERMAVPFYDTDDAVESRTGQSIPDIFATRGEQGFRALERDVIIDLLEEEEAVVALGGGAVEIAAIRERLGNATVVYLDVSPDEALRRIGGSSRPMLKERDPSALQEERRPLYEGVSDATVTSDGSIQETTELVMTALEDLKRSSPNRASGHVTEIVRVEVPQTPYDVHVGRGISSDLGSLTAAFGDAEHVFVITQAALAAPARDLSLPKAHILLLDEGEGAKSLDSVQRVYETFAAYGAHRHDLVVAFGGGVVTDVAGFVASTFNRGMPLVNVPTTLLGQVDAGIGGKTGVNLERGKNLVGTIYQPDTVVCDVDLIATLPKPEFVSGLAEVIKYGFIADPSLLETVQKLGSELQQDLDTLADVVARCARVKGEIVAADEREAGVRAHLNYGHTFAHAIEQLSGYGNIRHGEAVSLGMVAAAYLAHELDMVGQWTVARHLEVLTQAGLPTQVKLDLERMSEAWLRDKKYRGGVRFVLLKEDAGGTLSPQAGIDAPREAIAQALNRLAG